MTERQHLVLMTAVIVFVGVVPAAAFVFRILWWGHL